MSTLTNREQSLVALGAAIAGNGVPCVEHHVPGAKEVGLSETQITEALRIADKVRRVSARKVLETALARIETSPDESTDTAGRGVDVPNRRGALKSAESADARVGQGRRSAVRADAWRYALGAIFRSEQTRRHHGPRTSSVVV